jgi:HAD superfamily hydrolase (TIGR01509 family)
MADLKALKVVVYDLDGVVVDSSLANQAFYNHILAHFGRPPLTYGQWQAVRPLTAPDAIDLLFQGDPRREPAQAYQHTVDNRPFLALLTLEPRVRETLEALRRRYRTAIVTNRGKSLPLVLAALELDPLFDKVVSSLEVSRPKPDPQGLELILAHFQVEPREACYIGDSDLDRRSAASAGVPFGAYRHRELAADFYLDDHRDLLNLLGVSW